MNYIDNLSRFTSAIASRGENYFKEGRVSNLKVLGNTVSATVSGSEEYHVQLTFNNNHQLLKGFCSCPYEFHCKHEAAVLYALNAEQNLQKEDDSFRLAHSLYDYRRLIVERIDDYLSKRERAYLLEHLKEAKLKLNPFEAQKLATEAIIKILYCEYSEHDVSFLSAIKDITDIFEKEEEKEDILIHVISHGNTARNRFFFSNLASMLSSFLSDEKRHQSIIASFLQSTPSFKLFSEGKISFYTPDYLIPELVNFIDQRLTSLASFNHEYWNSAPYFKYLVKNKKKEEFHKVNLRSFFYFIPVTYRFTDEDRSFLKETETLNEVRNIYFNYIREDQSYLDTCRSLFGLDEKKLIPAPVYSYYHQSPDRLNALKEDHREELIVLNRSSAIGEFLIKGQYLQESERTYGLKKARDIISSRALKTEVSAEEEKEYTDALFFLLENGEKEEGEKQIIKSLNLFSYNNSESEIKILKALKEKGLLVKAGFKKVL